MTKFFNGGGKKEFAKGKSVSKSDFETQVNFDQFRKKYNSSLNQFLGEDGQNGREMSWTARRRVMQVLRQATRVTGPGKKSRIGRLGGGAALGAVAMSFATPAMAQYVAGGGSTAAAGAVAIGTGATVANINGVATGANNASVGNGAVAIGNNNNVDTFAAPNTITDNGILDRATGGTFNFPNGAASQQGAGVAVGQGNLVDAAGIAIGSNNQANHATNVTLAIGLGNHTSGAYGSAIGVGNLASGSSSIAVGVANVASNNTAIALGRQSTASGQTSIAIGNVTTASQNNAIAIGHSTQATDAGTIAIGGGNNSASTSLDATAARASGPSAIAIGTASASAGSRATALGAGATASGGNTVAVGDGTLASGGASTAIGQNTQATGNGALAIGGPGDFGGQTIARGNDSIAIGPGAQTATGSIGATAVGSASRANSLFATAYGDNANATGTNSIAVGRLASTNGTDSTAVGRSASAGADNASAFGVSANAAGISTTAIGQNASATGNFGTAIGFSSTAGNTNSFAGGRNAQALGASSVAIGHDVAATAADTVAIGHSSTAVGPGSVSIGLGQTSTGRGAVAIGDPNVANGTGAVTLGADNIAGGNATGTIAANGAVAIGSGNVAIGQGSVAIGNNSDALLAGAVAIGDGAIASNVRDVALGTGSVTTAPHTGAFTINGGTVAAATSNGVVSVGTAGSERQIQNVAAGVVSATSTDAINGSQLYLTELATNNLGESIEDVIGAGLDLDVDGTITTAPSFTVAAGTQTNIGAAFDALDDANTLANNGIASAIGGGMTIAANGTVTPPVINVNGTNYGNVADAVSAAGAGFSFTTGATGTGVANGISVSGVGAGETHSLTAGNNIITSQTGNDVAIALNPALTGITSLAITGGPTLSGTGINMNGDGITGLAAGSTATSSTEAINGGQLNTALSSVATDLGGGASYDPVTGQLTAPGYAIDGATYNNVGDALAALAAGNRYADFSSTLAAANASGVNSSAVGPNAQAAGNNASAFGVNSDATGTNSLALGSGAVATGNNSVALGSNSQAGVSNAGWTGTTIAGQSMTNAQNANAVVSISGGSTNRQLTGVADGAVNATSTDAVNGAQLFATATALDNKATNIGAGLASSLGGGASVTANGTVTNPTINVNGTTYTNVTDAVQAAGAGFNFTTAASGTGVANGTSIASIGAGETHTITAGNNIVATQTGNGVELALNPALSDITSLAINGGATINGTGINMNGDGITGLAAGSTAAGSTDAVNGGQLNTGLASVASNLGSGSAYNPLTGTVTAPAYAIQGTTFNNVGAALGAVDGNLSNVLNGTAGLVQQAGGSPGAGAISVGAATGGTSISIGGTLGSRTLTDVAAGAITAASDDAVNGSQVFANNTAIAGLLGGGAGVDPLTGALTAPSYTVGGNTLGDVGSAIAALQSGAPVQYSTVGAPTTPNGLVPSQNMTLVGAASGPVTLSNVGPAGLTAISTDAVNGSQLNTLASSNAMIIGGGSAFDPATGTLTGPSIAVGGTNYANITDAIEAGDDKADALGADTAAALGGGATYNPATGNISGMSFTLSGNTYTNVGAALAAVDSGEVGLVRQVGGAPSTGQVTVAAQTGGTSISVAGTDGNRIVTGIAAGGVNATSSDAVNGAQLFASQQAGAASTDTLGVSVASNLGGTAAYDPATDTVSGLAIDVAGGTQTNVTDAIEALDAANTNANNGLAAVLGGGAAVAPDGTVTAPVFTVQGATYGDVASALGGVNTNITNLNEAANGGGIKYFHANSTAADSAPVGADSIAIGPVAGAGGDRSISIGLGSNSLGTQSIAIGTGNVVTGNNSGAIGDPNTVNGNESYALGNNNTIDANNAFVLGNSVTIVAGLDGSVALGNATTVAAPNTGAFTVTGGTVAGIAPTSVVSVGAAGAERQITNVAAGVVSATSTNAINGSQLFAVGNALLNTQQTVGTLIGGGAVISPDGLLMNAPAISVGGVTYGNATDAIQAGDAKANLANTGLANALGGGATVAANGTVTAPSYTVQGATFGNVGAAIGAVDTKLTSLDGSVTNLLNGTSGLVQQTGGAPGAGAISIGVATGGTTVNVAGTSGNRTVTGVAAGAVTATSADAVNGAQLFAVRTTADGALQRSGGTLTGSINAGGNSITNLAAPIAGGDATNKTYVDGVAAAGSAKSDALGTSAAAALGGGASYNPTTGAVSAPSYSVGGRSYGDVGSALGASNMLAVQYVPDAAGAPTNAVALRGDGSGAAVGVTNVADGAVNATSRDAVNGGQLFGVQQTANGALQRTGGTLSGELALSGNRISGVGAPVQANDAANKAYVDQLQSQTNQQLGALTGGLNRAFNRIERNSQGVALAIAMGGGFLSDDKDFSLWGAWGNFDGYNALSAQTYIRLTDDVVINGGASFGLEENLVGTRVGIGIQF